MIYHTQHMLKIGFKRSEHDHCLYYCNASVWCEVYLLLYVDDVLIANSSKTEITRLKNPQKFAFNMKYLGNAKKVLRMIIKRSVEENLLMFHNNHT